MNTDRFVERVLDKVNPDAQPPISALTKRDKDFVEHAVQEEADREFDKLGEDDDHDDFKIDTNAKKRIEDRIENQIFNSDPGKINSAKLHASILIKDYQWTVKNSRLLRKLRDSIEEFKASMGSTAN